MFYKMIIAKHLVLADNRNRNEKSFLRTACFLPFLLNRDNFLLNRPAFGLHQSATRCLTDYPFPLNRDSGLVNKNRGVWYCFFGIWLPITRQKEKKGVKKSHFHSILPGLYVFLSANSTQNRVSKSKLVGKQTVFL